MNSYESQFAAIIGDGEYSPRQPMPLAKSQALSAVIYNMPVSQTSKDGFFTFYEGWCPEQRTYLSVMIDQIDGTGHGAVCSNENLLDRAAED